MNRKDEIQAEITRLQAELDALEKHLPAMRRWGKEHEMTDQELLELAAKAAGIELVWERDIPQRIEMFRGHLANYEDWNPLTDDGDALRLLTKLAFRELYISEIGASVSWRRGGSPHGFKCDEYASEHGGDLNVATRRAIVRAAAALALDEGEEK